VNHDFGVQVHVFPDWQELKDTVTKIMSGDIKQKVLDSLTATFNAVYSMAVGNTYDAADKTVEQVRLKFKTLL
jgi:hypothetical protein